MHELRPAPSVHIQRGRFKRAPSRDLQWKAFPQRRLKVASSSPAGPIGLHEEP
jgi:hypothetical protein